MIKKTLAIAVTYGLISVPLVSSSDPVPKPPVLCLQGSPCQQPAPLVPAPSPSPPPASTTQPPARSGAVKFQPGWYAYYDATCAPSKSDCDSSYIVSVIKSEICPNANLVGLKIAMVPVYLIPNTANVGNYTGNSAQGFTAIDAILDALQHCTSGPKYLMLEGTMGPFGGYGDPSTMVPDFTYPSSGCGLYSCAGGTARGGAYGVVQNTQGSQAGFTAKIWQDDWRDLAIAAITAYCKRYDSNPSFYSIGILFYNTSLPFKVPYPGGLSYDAYVSQYRTYLTAARAACPTTNVTALLDFTDNSAQMSTMVDHLRTEHGAMSNNDTVATNSQGQAVYTGASGGTDYRGVERYFESVESGNMCGNWQGNVSPATIFGIMQNGNANNRPRWPSHITIMMAGECDSVGTGWAAWKTFIASKSGKVMNGRDSTLRTPAEVKASWCESGMTCQ